MDPPSVLSIAAAVAQFIDFTAGVISAGSDIFQSTKGASADNLVLEAVCLNLQTISEKLVTSAGPPQPGPSSAEPAFRRLHPEERLMDLSSQCKSDCNELLEILRTLKVDGDKYRLWRSIKAGLGTAWKGQKIRDLEKRLGQAQKTMILCIGDSVRYYLDRPDVSDFLP